jgi:RNA polymerase sigma-70 factor (ECF subfamily)
MAMVKALTKITTYRGEAAMFTWLCTFCRHEIAAWFARGGHASAVALVEDRPDARGAFESLARIDEGDPDAALRRREVSRLVQATLDHLPARYADVLEWKYILGLSVDEIAGRLGLSGKAAESLLTRARQAFRDGFSTVAGGWPT